LTFSSEVHKKLISLSNWYCFILGFLHQIHKGAFEQTFQITFSLTIIVSSFCGFSLQGVKGCKSGYFIHTSKLPPDSELQLSNFANFPSASGTMFW
jgi:hypothetical protein